MTEPVKDEAGDPNEGIWPYLGVGCLTGWGKSHLASRKRTEGVGRRPLVAATVLRGLEFNQSRNSVRHQAAGVLDARRRGLPFLRV